MNRYSRRITQPRSQGASQAQLHALGLSRDDLAKAQVGIASVWFEGNPCNVHLGDLADHVKRGVASADLVGLRFNTIGVSDGMSMGTEGMSYSLPSPRPDRRLDRVRDVGPVVRRERLDRRL